MGEIDFEQLEIAAGRLGDAVIDPAVWPELMDGICRAVGATGAALLQSDARTPDVPYTSSIEGLYKRYFGDGWHQRDTRANKGVPLLLRGGALINDEDVVTPEEMAHDPYYNECNIPCGFKWFTTIAVWAGPALWGLAIQRTPREGPFEAQDKRILAPLSQRLSEAATLSTAIGRLALSSATGALNAVHQPAVAIDRTGLVLDANALAHALFDRDFGVANRHLALSDALAKNCLEKLLEQLRACPEAVGLPASPIVARRKGRAPVVIRLLPVPPAARGPFLGARALLTFTVVEPRTGPCAPLLVTAFALTPAEAKRGSVCAEGLARVRGAEQLGIARETARVHLKAVFAKTGTHRQAELVALLARV
jgi:DNA-binding CsgD family transcriptional regulator